MLLHSIVSQTSIVEVVVDTLDYLTVPKLLMILETYVKVLNPQ